MRLEYNVERTAKVIHESELPNELADSFFSGNRPG
jgi:hypothetical protein